MSRRSDDGRREEWLLMYRAGLTTARIAEVCEADFRSVRRGCFTFNYQRPTWRTNTAKAPTLLVEMGTRTLSAPTLLGGSPRRRSVPVLASGRHPVARATHLTSYIWCGRSTTHITGDRGQVCQARGGHDCGGFRRLATAVPEHHPIEQGARITRNGLASPEKLLPEP